MKKIILSLISIFAIALAIYGIYNAQKTNHGKPTRQGTEIR